jgi:hypothetical protein
VVQGEASQVILGIELSVVNGIFDKHRQSEMFSETKIFVKTKMFSETFTWFDRAESAGRWHGDARSWLPARRESVVSAATASRPGIPSAKLLSTAVGLLAVGADQVNPSR